MFILFSLFYAVDAGKSISMFKYVRKAIIYAVFFANITENRFSAFSVLEIWIQGWQTTQNIQHFNEDLNTQQSH